MPAREHKLEPAAARLAKKRDGAAAETVLAGVVFDLLQNSCGVFRAVEADENLPNHRLLVFGEEGGNFSVGDHPVVVHLGAERMVEGVTDRFLLLGGESFVERRDERFGSRPRYRS